MLPKSSSHLDQPSEAVDLVEQETSPELTEISPSRDNITVSRSLYERRSTVDVTKIETKSLDHGQQELSDEKLDMQEQIGTDANERNVGRSLSADNDDKLADEEVENLTTRFRKRVELDSDQLVSLFAKKLN